MWCTLYTCIAAGQGEGSINQQLMSSGIDVLIHHLHPLSHKYSFQKVTLFVFAKGHQHSVHIWVSFCRTGKMSVSCPFFFKVESLCDQT